MEARPNRNIDRVSQEIEKKYIPQVNNPKGHNKHTPKKDLARKEEILSELKQFKNLGMLDQKDAISKLGNEIYIEGRELTKKKSLCTKMKNEFFGWEFKED